MKYEEIALELVKIAREKQQTKQDDVIDLYINFLNRLRQLENNA